MVSHPDLLCLLEGVKTDMKPVGFQEDQIQILMKMKIMKGRDGKEVRELLKVLVWKEEKKREGDSQSCFMDSLFLCPHVSSLLILSL